MATTTEDRDDGGAGGERLKARSPLEFLRQVRQEGRRVTWATRKEVWVSSLMVVFMVAAASIFFFLVDAIIAFGIGLILPKA